MSGKTNRLFILIWGLGALLFTGPDVAGDSAETAGAKELVLEVPGGDAGPVFYSLKTGQKVADPASRDWDIAFERPRLIYTNSGETAAALGSGGLGGVWHTEKTDFAGVIPADAVKNDPQYGPYNTDATRWIEGAMLKPAASRRINVMTFTGYQNETKKDGKTRAAAFSASFSYNKRQFYSARGMPPAYTVNSRVYLVRHGDGRGESKFQVLAYESRQDTDRYVVAYQFYPSPD
jgi:hypothetical protein